MADKVKMAVAEAVFDVVPAAVTAARPALGCEYVECQRLEPLKMTVSLRRPGMVGGSRMFVVQIKEVL